MTKQEQLKQYLNGSVLYTSIGSSLDIYILNESAILILDHELKGFTIWEANTERAVGWLRDFLRDIDESNSEYEKAEWFNALEYWLVHSKETSRYKRIIF